MSHVMNYPATRFSLAGSLALIITFILFFLMQSLIENSGKYAEEIKDTAFTLDFVRVPKPETDPPRIITERFPEPEDYPPIPEIEPGITPGDVTGITEVTVIPPPIDVPTGPVAGGVASGDLLPIVKVQPVYPVTARSRGIEGYVIVEFTVTAFGTTRDIRVVEASPSGIFDKAAISAASRFKYKPRVIKGQGVEVTGVQNLFTFVLEE
jgi:protein TonB